MVTSVPAATRMLVRWLHRWPAKPLVPETTRSNAVGHPLLRSTILPLELVLKVVPRTTSLPAGTAATRRVVDTEPCPRTPSATTS